MTRLLLLLIFIGMFVGCGEVLPPGKKVMLMHPSGENEVIDNGLYHAWGRTKAVFIDQKYISKEERMQVLCEDDINLSVDVKGLIGFQTSKDEHLSFIKNKVPAVPVDGRSELSLDHFYSMVLSDLLRGTARNIISRHATDEVRPIREKLEFEIQTAFKERVDQLNYPVEVSAVILSNIDYPKSVTDTREQIKQAELEDQKKAALADAELAEQKRQVAVEQEKAKVRMIIAQAQADENQILTNSLTPEFLMWRQLEVMQDTASKLANGSSNTVFMMPYQTMSPEMLNTAVIRDSMDK